MTDLTSRTPEHPFLVIIAAFESYNRGLDDNSPEQWFLAYVVAQK